MGKILTLAPHQGSGKQGEEEDFQAWSCHAFWVSKNDKLLHDISYLFTLD